MSLRSALTGFWAKMIDARFTRDDRGRLLFFPWGHGAGRVVPDAAVEARLRRGTSAAMLTIFAIIIPSVAILNSAYQPTGFLFLAYIVFCAALGYLVQLYPVWLSRGLARSEERRSYAGAMIGSLDKFGRGFLVFGLLACLVFAAGSALAVIFGGPSVDRAVMLTCVVIFVPTAAVYAVALWRKRRSAARPPSGSRCAVGHWRHS